MKKFILLAAAAFSLAACNNDDNYTDEPVAARITATIGNGDVSRAGDTSWANGDAIGITMAQDRYVNLKYTTDAGDGIFKGATTMYFKNKSESVTLSAYYPFGGNEGVAPGKDGIIEASTKTADQTSEKQTQFDFLYDSKTVSGSQPDVKFTFSHKMSKLTLIFKNGKGADVSKLTTYTVEGLILQGTFNTVSGDCAAKSGVAAENLKIDLDNLTVTEGLAQIPSLILFPQTIGNKVMLRITDSDGQDYACELKFDGNSLLSGNNYQYTVTVNKTGLTVNQSTIQDWVTKPSETETVSE